MEQRAWPGGAWRAAAGILDLELRGRPREWASTPEALADEVRRLFGPARSQPMSGPPWVMFATATAATAWRLYGARRGFNRAQAQALAVEAALRLCGPLERDVVVGSLP